MLSPSPLTPAAAARDGWRQATCLPTDCFCEGLREGFVRQPSNTWSSLAFVMVAAWVALRLQTRSTRIPALSGASGWLLVSSLAITGLGSAFYHASLTFAGQVLDVSGMYLIATFILFHRLGPKWRLSTSASAFGFVAVNAGLMAAQVRVPAVRRVTFGLLLVSALAVEWRSSRMGRTWLSGGASLMVVAFLIWILDRERLVCAPFSLIQGHAVWHVLGAAAAACLFKSYEREAKT